jgi:hypothetical protein
MDEIYHTVKTIKVSVVIMSWICPSVCLRLKKMTSVLKFFQQNVTYIRYHFYLLVKTVDSGKNPPPFTTKHAAHYIIYREHISCQVKTFLLYQLHCNL